LPSSSQPNLYAPGGAVALSWRFWLVLPLVGVGGGLAGAALLLLLHAVQHLFWDYRAGSFVAAAQAAGVWHRVAIVAAAGLIVGVYRWATQ